ncbi:MAG: glycosyltransferase [Desulfosalsimonadaceae bacterium]|nr:glycosyltransferase [Desulfosalsimonadaceae bacterium]
MTDINGNKLCGCFLVIPHYRDTDRLKPYLADLMATLPDWVTIQVSDDGSGAAGFRKLELLMEQARKERLLSRNGPEILAPVTLGKNQGKGAAVLAGWRQSSTEDFLAFVDADGAVSASELLRALMHMRAAADRLGVLIGSRIKMAGHKVERRLIRHLGGRVFATSVSLISGLAIYDTQCGLKILRRDVYEAVSLHMRTAGFAFDVELLMLATRLGFMIEEFPVDWQDIPGSKISLLKHSLPMLREVARAKRHVDLIFTAKSKP